jgi:hypothetical protein
LHRTIRERFAAVLLAETVVDDLYRRMPGDSAPTEAQRDFERAAGRAVESERKIRDALIKVLDQLAASPDAPVACLVDGGVATLTPQADGLCVVGPGKVIVID